MITTVTPSPQTQEQSNFQLRSLIVVNKVEKHTLASLFNKCGYLVDMTSFNEDLKHKLAVQYDMLFVEVAPDNQQGFDLISSFHLKNPDANVVTMTLDNQKPVEIQARSMKVDYHLIAPYSTNEIISILTHLAVRQKKWRREHDQSGVN